MERLTGIAVSPGVVDDVDRGRGANVSDHAGRLRPSVRTDDRKPAVDPKQGRIRIAAGHAGRRTARRRPAPALLLQDCREGAQHGSSAG